MNKYTDAAFEVNLPCTKKAVLWILCHRADKDGVSWPSYGSIAKYAGIHRTTAMSAVKSLMKDGFVFKAGTKLRPGSGNDGYLNLFRVSRKAMVAAKIKNRKDDLKEFQEAAAKAVEAESAKEGSETEEIDFVLDDVEL